MSARCVRPLVYAAHPLSCYGTVHAEVRLAALRGLLLDVDVIDPEACGWASNTDWQAGWPILSETLSGLVVFGTADGTIGAGCLREIGPRRFSRQSGIAWSTVSQFVNDRPGSPQLTQRIAIALAHYTPTPPATRLVPCGHCQKPTSRRRWCSDRCRMAATRAGAA